jgi:hypothetical protein
VLLFFVFLERVSRRVGERVGVKEN